MNSHYCPVISLFPKFCSLPVMSQSSLLYYLAWLNEDNPWFACDLDPFKEKVQCWAGSI